MVESRRCEARDRGRSRQAIPIPGHAVPGSRTRPTPRQTPRQRDGVSSYHGFGAGNRRGPVFSFRDSENKGAKEKLPLKMASTPACLRNNDDCVAAFLLFRQFHDSYSEHGTGRGDNFRHFGYFRAHGAARIRRPRHRRRRHRDNAALTTRARPAAPGKFAARRKAAPGTRRLAGGTGALEKRERFLEGEGRAHAGREEDRDRRRQGRNGGAQQQRRAGECPQSGRRCRRN